MRERGNLAALVLALAVLVLVPVAYGVARGVAEPASPARARTAPAASPTPIGPPTGAAGPARYPYGVAFMCSGTGPAWENTSVDPSLSADDCAYQTLPPEPAGAPAP